ncbi:hypothetical protein D9613_006371 [Agrocybe pediades]|uniref:Uncharacterized protein n=1 Tax=Agrocybe pediades TaxID=84607 RepID=A0A8H4QV73_9AGAR|nr:hypothetical protein D9613_006371 [Agrocybe pediades]
MLLECPTTAPRTVQAATSTTTTTAVPRDDKRHPGSRAIVHQPPQLLPERTTTCQRPSAPSLNAAGHQCLSPTTMLRAYEDEAAGVMCNGARVSRAAGVERIGL